MKVGTIHQIFDTFEKAFQDLQVDVPSTQLENLGVTIHKVMAGPSRNYHTPQHVFDLVDPADPLQSLAALFHDVVYYQVDRGILPEIKTTLLPYIQEKEEEIFISKQADPSDEMLALVLEVFAFEPGQKLSTSSGLNEFLSALFMVKKLIEVLPKTHLLQIAACIEATIPFRGTNDQGQSHFDVLETRLAAINQKHHLATASKEIEAAVKRAVLFSNSDVASFSQHDPGKFLDDAWKLLPETNTALRTGEIYSIREYRRALEKMKCFYDSLNPAHVFHHYKGAPPQDTFQHLSQCVHDNIHIAREYIGVKLLAIAIIEALAKLTGGDVPLALFMGELEREGQSVQGLENFLPPIEVSSAVDQSATVFRLLNSGRASESSFDIRRSPTSLFLYTKLGPDRVNLLLESATLMFEGQLEAQAFLNKIDGPIISTIAKACAAMVPTRRQTLLALADHFEQQ